MGNTSNRELPVEYVPLEKYECLAQRYAQSVQNGSKWKKISLIVFAVSIAGGFYLIKIIRSQRMDIEYLRFDENQTATKLGQCKQLRLVHLHVLQSRRINRYDFNDF